MAKNDTTMIKGAVGRRPRGAGVDGNTRSEILAAARSVFARKGYEGASTREVASAARVNNAMIYYHFRDKSELYKAVLAQAFAEFDQIWDHPVFASQAASRRKIQTYIEGFIRFQQANEDIRRIMSMEFASCRRNYRWIADNHYTANYRKLAGLMQEAMRRREMKRIELPLAISSLVGMVIHSFILRPIAQHVIGRKLDLDEKRFGRFVTALFFDGLGSCSAAERFEKSRGENG